MDKTLDKISNSRLEENKKPEKEASSLSDSKKIVIPKELRCSKKKKVCILTWILIFIVASLALALGLYFGLKKEESRYKPPQIGVIFRGNYTSAPYHSNSNETDRFLQDSSQEEASSSITFIVVNSSATTIDMIVIPGVITDKQLRNLRNLEESNNENDDITKIPIFLVTANVEEGKVDSLQASKSASPDYTENVLSGVQIALVSTNGDDQARNMASKEICEDHFGVLYCPKYKKQTVGNYYVLTASYGKDSLNKHRSLEESDDLISKSEVNINKQSYIDSSTGALIKSEATGDVNIPMVTSDSSSNQNEEVQNFTLNQNVSANFEYDSQSLTVKESVELHQYITTKVEFVNVDISAKPKGSVGDTSGSGGSTRRNLGIYVENKFKLVDVLGLPIFFKSVLQETESANLKATASIQFSSLLSLEFGSQEFGNGFLNKLKKLFTLKNLYEKLINDIQGVITNYANNELKKFNDLVLIKLAELQSLLVDSSQKLTNFIDGILNKGKAYADNVISVTNEYQKKYEKQVSDFQKLMQNVTETTLDPLKKKIDSVKELKKGYETELQNGIKSLNELKDTTLKNLNSQKDQLINQINAEVKKYGVYVNVEKAFKEIKDEVVLYAKQQVMDLEIVGDTVKSYELLSTTVKGELTELKNYVQSEVIEYKSQIDSKIDELTKNVEDIKYKIFNEVTAITDQINTEIEDLNSKVAELQNEIESGIKTEKENLIAQRDALLAQIKEKRSKLENEIAQKKELLENQKKDFEQTLNLKIEEARTELNSQLTKWEDQSKNIQDTLSKKLSDSISVAENTINQAKSKLNSELENLKKTMNEEVNEKRYVLEQSISSIEKQIELEVLNLESIAQLKSEINSALDYGKLEIESLNNEIGKTKEQISEEIRSIKTGIQNQIVYLESELKSKVYDIKSVIDSEILSKQEKIKELRNQLENAAESTANDLQKQINSIEAEVLELQSRLPNLSSLETELLSQKKTYEDKLKEIKQDYTYQLYLKANSFKDFFTNQESRVKLISSKIISLNDSLKTCSNSLSSVSDKVSDAYTKEIESYPKSIDSNIKSLNSTEQDVVSSILAVQIQITTLTLKNENLNSVIIEATFNLTEIQQELDNAINYYNTLQKSFNDAKSTLDSILNGTFDWTSFFKEKGLFSIKDEIENEIKTVFDTLNSTISQMETAINTAVKVFDTASSLFTSGSKDKSSQMLNSGKNINSLALSSSLSSKTDLFDFKSFIQIVNQVTTTFNTVKSTVDTLINLSTKNIAEDLNKLAQIVNPSYWEEKLNAFVSKFTDIEKKFRIKLNLSDFKGVILQKLDAAFKVKITKVINLLSVKDKLKGIVDDFAINALQSIVSSQALTKTFINYLGDLTSVSKNLLAKSKNYALNLGYFPTPIGAIAANLNVNSGISLDLITMLSASKLSVSLIPSGNLVLFASAAWSFVVGKVGAGVQATVKAALPIEFGVGFTNPAVYYLANLNLSLGGNAGLYYVTLTITWVRRCIGRRWYKFCFRVPQITYTSPKFIISANWNSKSTIAIIPYKKIDL